MIIIGITGPTGAGKGVCCSYFQSLGIPVIDTDRVYHALIDHSSPCTQELVSFFGNEIANENGGVDRKRLASIVFSDPTKTKVGALNQITHKYVLKETKRYLAQYREAGCIATVVDAPLLFEAEFDRFCDFCISVLAPIATRRDRILSRDSLSAKQADERLFAQKTDDFYITRSKYVIENNSDVDVLQNTLKKILEKEGLAS